MIFLAGRSQLQVRQLHTNIKRRLQTVSEFHNVRSTIAPPRDPGPRRVIAETDPQALLNDKSYPVTDARIEIGFQLSTPKAYEYYWFNWIEPSRDFLLGWHQDGDHPSLNEVHIQVNDRNGPAVHRQATFINKHPMAVVDARLDQLHKALSKVQWDQKTDTISSFNW